ncbi:hypothetical protein ASD50_07795 [Mesorhizobium sp. Root552]|uniref:DUF982 domain-containing protein n=1 Tax=Mesorhizobium sp. Root552 TaxID=1736555 RepID=UPI0006F68DE5|nr:hypothetical protein ASD50_07795 [Mesorhizobium sp. Root552]
MPDANFDIPVLIRSRRWNCDLKIARVAQAAVELSYRWPTDKRGPTYKRAIASVAGALARRVDVGQACSDFVEAAREAGLLIEDDTKKPPQGEG